MVAIQDKEKQFMNGVTQNYIEWVDNQVTQIKNEYGIRSEKHAFAMWSVGYLLELSNDEAYQQADTLARGDCGLDAWYIDDDEEIFQLFQMKYPDRPREGKMGPEPMRELLTALDIIGDIKTASERSNKLGEISQIFNESKQAGYSVVLNCVVFGRVSSDAENEFKNRCMRANVRGEIWDLERLYELYITRELIQGLQGQEVAIDISSDEHLKLKSRSTDNGIEEAIVFNFDGKEFAKEISKYSPEIFTSNVRYHLGKQNKVNTKIKSTLVSEEDHEYFWYYNNGITILVDDYRFISNNDRKKLVLINPQIVNGCQTVSTMINNYRSIPNGVYLLSKIIKLADGEQGRKQALSIATATNSQSPVKSSDLKANDLVQKAIQASFKSLRPSWHYERKRGEWNELSSAEKSKYAKRRVNMADIGQTWLSYIGEPVKAISSKDTIFSESMVYKKVYKKGQDVRTYLLAHTLFKMFDEFIRADNLEEIKKGVSGIDENTLNRLIRGKKLVVAHSVAMSKYLLDLRYKQIEGSESQKIINLLNTDQEFRSKILNTITAQHKRFVASQDSTTDIRQLYKELNTINILRSYIDDHIDMMKTVDKSIEDMLRDI